MLKRWMTGPAAGALAGLLVAGTADPTRAHAQAAVPGPYERARLLVESGRGAAGRVLTDSLVNAAAPRSAALAEALWWRAALAADARDSERDLRRIAAEVPESPRSGAAVVRLAQLALLRDRPEEAAALLAPVARPPARDRPADPARPLAAYWLARVRLEQRDPAGACGALNDVGGTVDAELADQAGSLRARLPGCVDPVAVAVVPPGPVPGPVPGPLPAPLSTPLVTQRPATATSGSVASAAPRTTAPATAGERAPVVAAAPPATPAPSTAATASPRSVPPSAAPASTAPAAPAFAVQVAAYDGPTGAAALAARLRATGLEAASEGQGPAGDQGPFRVKVGRYATRAAAVEGARELRRRGLTGFVTLAPRAPAPPAAP